MQNHKVFISYGNWNIEIVFLSVIDRQLTCCPARNRTPDSVHLSPRPRATTRDATRQGRLD